MSRPCGLLDVFWGSPYPFGLQIWDMRMPFIMQRWLRSQFAGIAPSAGFEIAAAEWPSAKCTQQPDAAVRGEYTALEVEKKKQKMMNSNLVRMEVLPEFRDAVRAGP